MNNKRAIHLLAVFCVMFITLIGYITYIEIRHGNEYTQSVYNARNTVRDQKVLRGSIYDRNMTTLAYSEEEGGKITRKYPFDNLYSHVIGYVSKDYSNRTLLEMEYNADLLGGDSLSNVMNIKNRIETGKAKGNDLYLTIDNELQKAADEALGSYNGAIVAMNPKTGEILAMVSKPDFNPNPDVLSKNYDKLSDSTLYSRAFQVTYPPGSTFKTVMSASIFENGFENETYNDRNGQITIESDSGDKLNNHTFQNENKKYAYGMTDLKTAFRYSSNVYYAYMGSIMDTDMLQKTAEDFYFNKDISFDMPVKKSSFQTGSMTNTERAMASIGQGKTEATPLHLALIASAVANDGIMPRPYVVSSVKSGAIPVYSATNKNIGRVTDKETAQKIKDMMLDVVKSGTGSAAQISGIDVCGKTGTSENALTASDKKNSSKTHALFIGFAPYDDPQIAISVIMEHAGFGGSAAAPAARKVMQKFFTELQ